MLCPLGNMFGPFWYAFPSTHVKVWAILEVWDLLGHPWDLPGPPLGILGYPAGQFYYFPPSLGLNWDHFGTPKNICLITKHKQIEVRTRSQKTKTRKRENKKSLRPWKTELSIESGFKIHKIRSIENRLHVGTIFGTFWGAKVTTIPLFWA